MPTRPSSTPPGFWSRSSGALSPSAKQANGSLAASDLSSRTARMARVSIVLPTFNRADTILRAVESVRAQTFQDWELIVSDDGSPHAPPTPPQRPPPRLPTLSPQHQP